MPTAKVYHILLNDLVEEVEVCSLIEHIEISVGGYFGQNVIKHIFSVELQDLNNSLLGHHIQTQIQLPDHQVLFVSHLIVIDIGESDDTLSKVLADTLD